MRNDGHEAPKGPRNGLCGIFIRERGEIMVHKNVMSALNNPAYLLFWWSDRERMLLLSASNEKTPASIVVPDSCNRRKNGVRFTNRELLGTICSLTGWEDKISHRLTGEFVPELDMIAFRISDTV